MTDQDDGHRQLRQSYYCNKCGYFGVGGPEHTRLHDGVQCDYLAVSTKTAMLADQDKELRRLAEAATPGPWKIAPAGTKAYERADPYPFDMIQVAPARFVRTEGRSENEANSNAAFIAAANPATILSLLDRLEAAERDAARYRFVRTADGIRISTKAARDPVAYDEAIDAAMHKESES